MSNEKRMIQFEVVDVKQGTLSGSIGYLAYSIAVRVKHPTSDDEIEVVLSAGDRTKLALGIDTLFPKLKLQHQPVKTAILSPEAIQPTVDDDDEL